MAPAASGTLVMSPDAPVPPTWVTKTDTLPHGWTQMAEPFDHTRFEAELRSAGWMYFYLASVFRGSAFGFNETQTLSRAMANLIKGVKENRYNCLEIQSVTQRSLLGIRHVSILAHPRHIQKGMALSKKMALPAR